MVGLIVNVSSLIILKILVNLCCWGNCQVMINVFWIEAWWSIMNSSRDSMGLLIATISHQWFVNNM